MDVASVGTSAGTGAGTDAAPLDEDALEALGEEIASFAVRIDLAERALLHKLRVFDAHGAWGPLGFLSCAHWLSWRVGIGLTAAREKVRVARALAELPEVDARFGRGELSYSNSRASHRQGARSRTRGFCPPSRQATGAFSCGQPAGGLARPKRSGPSPAWPRRTPSRI